jgi:aminoglycoside phosphotransferase family enzyme
MENIVDLVLNAENVRVLVLLVFGFCGYVLIKSQMKDLERSLLKAVDEKIAAFHNQLKANDFAHLNNTIEALTFVLEKNKFLTIEDKEYINHRLDR